ncbi:hypothetical protein Q8I65_06365 [Paenibacillus ottowii]|uniref:hypothetical protein n=1 Tax=Paenibacillus ottowii TaxID=2315729 RepID=UPI00273145AB|nr:hypothetical protein [Paenibacillus ottowii]MDP1509819.1 hypothetical protein [Paenibacillus ottowii]
MASEKTPNLGLNQIDRTSPKTTYFDLEKYLDQNWRSVDEFAGGVNDSVNEIKKRLDTTERKAVTLEPGVQIVHAEKAAPFSLTGLSGRTLVNLLGRAGSCDRIDSLLGWEADLAVDTSNKAQGTGSIKVTAKNASGVYNVYGTGLKLTGGRYYIALADVKNINASNNIYVNFSTGGNKALKQSKDQSRFVTIYTKCAPTNDTTTNLEVASISTATGQAFYADAIRLYEINASDYAALDSMTAEQVVTKYPYVDSIMPVRNPYAIRYGENMLPSLFEWSAKQGTPIIVDEKSITVTLDNKIVHTVSPLVPGQKYTVSVQSGGATGRVTVTDDPESAIIVEAVGLGLLSATFTATSRAANIRLLGTSSTAVTMTKPMLNIGSTANAFKPREDSMLALQTDLYADPVTGANADTVFERDGQYFKVKRFESVLLDGSRITKVNNVVSGTGFKALYPVVSGVNYAFVGNGSAVKFDGKILLWGGQDTTADRWGIDATSPNFAISVPVSDSGWADSYPPTLDDIRAYFFGYKAYDANTLTPAQAQAATTATWNGTGTKYWVQRVGAPNFTQSVPQQSYAGYTPYQLVYQLATPTVVPIVSEGQLSFVEGDNQVEVGTGIVLRENSGINTIAGAYAYINAEYPLKYKPRNIVAVYRNGKKDSRWEVIIRPGSDVFSPIGVAFARLVVGLYDPTDSFSTTYFMTADSPSAAFTGSYAANEKTLLTDLVDSVQENTARVSVLENKKADKDNPAWLTPTLLNGWTGDVQYLRLSDNLVLFRGGIREGFATPGTHLFTLPVGYRPKSNMEIKVRTSDGANDAPNSTIIINVSGRVVTQNAWFNKGAWFDGLSFLAEQ